MILRHFGAARIREVLRDHMRLAREFADRVDEHPDFERVAPVPFSVVCFRAKPRGITLSAPELDAFNEQLLDAVNADGEVFLSHTRLGHMFVIRMAIGHLRTTAAHTARAWQLLCEHTAALSRSA
jgi:aromatic-L-amino-acid decarboxylase